MFEDTLKHRYQCTSLVQLNTFIQQLFYFPGIVLVYTVVLSVVAEGVYHILDTTTPLNNDTPHQGVDQPLAYAQAYSEQASQAAHLPGSCPIDR